MKTKNFCGEGPVVKYRRLPTGWGGQVKSNFLHTRFGPPFLVDTKNVAHSYYPDCDVAMSRAPEGKREGEDQKPQLLYYPAETN